MTPPTLIAAISAADSCLLGRLLGSTEYATIVVYGDGMCALQDKSMACCLVFKSLVSHA